MDRGYYLSGRFMRVPLIESEIRYATHVGRERNAAAGAKKLHGAHGAPDGDKGEAAHIGGAIGELAVAKAFNLYWHPNIGNLEATDVGGILEVRTRSKPHYDLILHKPPKDMKVAPFILAIAHANSVEVELRGWIFASEGRLPKYWKDLAGGRPAYFVEQAALHPMADLIGYADRTKHGVAA